MNKGTMLRMQWFRDNYIRDANNLKILDVGSLDVNGSYRELFPEPKYKYLGLDICKGKNVDIVLNYPYNWDIIPTESFDIVISGNTLEHIEFFWFTFAEMVRVLKKDGLICVVVPRGYNEHRYPVDCYRFLTDGMIALARYCNLDIIHASTNCAPSKKDKAWYEYWCSDSMLIARKPYEGNTRTVPKYYKITPGDIQKYQSPLIPYSGKSIVRSIIKWKKQIFK